ncbi:MAG: sugar phosphate isomerase/epimerase [Kiritimatiellae bacterium]|nr:sugar phosphate isomerase/epimerase [Kiritimatiellia bacterium]
MDYVKTLAVQSYCFRGFKKNNEVAAKTRECGLAVIELCAVHVDFNNEAGFEDVIKLYRDSGIRICSIGVQSFSGKAEIERKWFEFAKRAGATTISASFTVDSVPASYRVAESLAEQYGVNVAIHNHGGRHWLGSSQMLKHVFEQTSPRIGLMLDTAWALDAHEDPVAMCEKFRNRLYGLHLKDFVFDRAGRPHDVVVGTGNLDLRSLFDTLKTVGFCGNLILEYEGDVQNPVPALKECITAIRNACV